MPNTFTPRAFARMIKSEADRLRVEYDGQDLDITEWHAIIHCLDDDATEKFLEQYNNAEELPAVISGVPEAESSEHGGD